MKTNRITGNTGCELNHTFDTEVVEALDPIYLSPNNDGVVFQTVVVGGYEGDPAVQESLTETYVMPAPIAGVEESGEYSIDVSSLVAGTMTVRFADALPIAPVTILGSETESQVYDKIVTATPEGWTSVNNTTSITITKDTVGANTLTIELDAGVTGAVITEDDYALGSPALTLTPGNISVYLNSATATEVAIDGTEADLAAVYAKIAAIVNLDYEFAAVGSIAITKVEAGANLIPLSIDLGSTGLTVDTSVFVPGEDADNDDVPKATSIDTEYTLDTIYNVRSGTALWNKIETIASGNTKLATIAYPVTALRINVKTAARDATTQVILRTSL